MARGRRLAPLRNEAMKAFVTKRLAMIRWLGAYRKRGDVSSAVRWEAGNAKAFRPGINSYREVAAELFRLSTPSRVRRVKVGLLLLPLTSDFVVFDHDCWSEEKGGGWLYASRVKVEYNDSLGMVGKGYPHILSKRFQKRLLDLYWRGKWHSETWVKPGQYAIVGVVYKPVSSAEGAAEEIRGLLAKHGIKVSVVSLADHEAIQEVYRSAIDRWMA